MPSNRKVVFIVPNTSEFGGLERHLLELLRRLREPWLQSVVLCFGRDTITPHLDSDQRKQVVVKCLKEPESFAEWFRLIQRARADIIVFCYSWIQAFPWQAPVAALLAGVKRRVSIQHLIPSLAPPPIVGGSFECTVRRMVGKRARYFLRGFIAGYVCNTTICVSDAVRDALVNDFRLPAGKTITIRNGVSTSSFAPSVTDGAAMRSRLGIPRDDFLLVCVARLAEAKGVDVLLEAIALVIRRGVACKCIIVGDGPLKEMLLQQRRSRGLDGVVFFEGFQEDVRPYLQAGSAFILTSHLEGLPLSILEAMACGLPCIVTNAGGSAEAVADHIVGLVIPPASGVAAADAISYLATHPEERARMASHTRETVCRRFDINRQMDKVVQTILN